MKWLLKFRRLNLPENEGYMSAVVRCREDELQGMKEVYCAWLEEKNGEPWVCISAVPLKSREDHHDD